MTVIAWDGLTLAADRQNTVDGNKACRCTKLLRTADGRLIGAAGNAATCHAMTEWLALPADARGELPEPQRHEDSSAHVLEVMPDGAVWRWEAHGAFPMGHGAAVCGSGGPYAMAAMACGRTAAEAVEIACRFDQLSAGPVDALALDAPVPCKLPSRDATDMAGVRIARSKGGTARAAALTPERRAEIARRGAAARWGNGGPVPPGPRADDGGGR